MTWNGVRRCRSRLTFVATLLPSLLACSDGPRSVAIGFASNMGSPSAADVAQAALDATQPSGHSRILVTTGDSGGRSPTAALPSEVDRALRFAQDPSVVALVGPGGSREALQTSPVYRDAKLPNVIPTGTSRRLRDLGPLTFVLAPNDSVQGEFIGQFIAAELQAKTAAIMYLPDEYGVGLAAGSAAALARLGVRLTARLPVRPDQLCPPRRPRNEYEDVVTDMLAYGTPDVVVLATRTSETSCIASAVRARAPSTLFVAGDGALVERFFVGQAGAAVNSVYLVAFWHTERPDSVSRRFVKEFRERVGREPRHDDAMFYDAVMLIGQAIRESGPSRADVASYLSQLGRSRPPYRGVTGPIAFTPGAPRPLIMTRLREGRPVPLADR